MPTTVLNGIRIAHEVTGDGPLVVLVMGSGSPGRVWGLHQVPALVDAGYRVVTFDNRGIGASDQCASGFTIDDMVRDVAALIEHHGAPASVVGTSLGARVTQELALARPDLVRAAVMCGAHARMTPAMITLNDGEIEMAEKGIRTPARYSAGITALLNLSPATLRDATAVQDWLDIFEFSSTPPTPGAIAQMRLDRGFDRREAYRAIRVPSLVVAYADDRVIDPVLSREVAEAIPGCGLREIADAGHYGYLERPEEFNRLVLGFLADHARG